LRANMQTGARELCCFVSCCLWTFRWSPNPSVAGSLPRQKAGFESVVDSSRTHRRASLVLPARSGEICLQVNTTRHSSCAWFVLCSGAIFHYNSQSKQEQQQHLRESRHKALNKSETTTRNANTPLEILDARFGRTCKLLLQTYSKSCASVRVSHKTSGSIPSFHYATTLMRLASWAATSSDWNCL
jgi:hypothetical protein